MLARFRADSGFLLRCRPLQYRIISATAHPKHYCRLDDVEDLEKYRPGGYHPVSIGDVFAGGRYEVLHKLGYGGSSTVWLVQDQRPREQSKDFGSLYALKALSAEQSSMPRTQIADMHIPQELDKFSGTINHPGSVFIEDHFSQEGPNGSHLFLILPLAGPSVLSMAQCPGRTSGSRRLRGDLARNVAKQVSTAVELLHSAGIIHGDLTPSNLLFLVSEKVNKWSVDDVYQNLGRPEVEEVVARNRSPPGPGVPWKVVAPMDISRLSSSSHHKEDILLIDFGQSFFADRPPPHNVPATPLHYLSPEAFFNLKISFASDVWALACTIFEIRAGSPLFDPFLSSDTLIIKQIVETLGKFPEPWWSTWESRRVRFDETGAPKPAEELKKSRGATPCGQELASSKIARDRGEG